MASTLTFIEAPAVHQSVSLVGGDDWHLDALLTDAADNPLNLNLYGTVIRWTLIDSNHNTALTSQQYSIALGTNPGEVKVTIPASSSTILAGGTYHDYFRVTLSGNTQTYLQGSLLVQADPFAAPVAAALRRMSQVATVRTLQVVERGFGG
jgi:hypothetical protein